MREFFAIKKSEASPASRTIPSQLYILNAKTSSNKLINLFPPTFLR